MNEKQTGITQALKMFFGIFMVLVYLGAAVLLATNVLDWPPTTMWTAFRWFLAVMFGAYGIFRGYREMTGDHTYGMRRYDDDEELFTSYNERLKEMETKNDEDKK